MRYARNMPDKCTYWTPGVPDGFGGVSYGAPVTVKCRWQDTQQLAIDSDGEQFTTQSIVYPAADVPLKAMLAKGVSVSATPVGAHEVRNVGSTHNLSGSKTITKVML